MAVRRCGICKLALREDDQCQMVRLRPGDLEGVEIGLYSACGDCAGQQRQRIAEKRPPIIERVEQAEDGSSHVVQRPKRAEELSEYDLT